MTGIGKEVRCRLKLIPTKAVVLEDWYDTYVCQNCRKEDTEAAIVKASKAPNFIPARFATPEAAAHLIPQGIFSCGYGLDLYHCLTWFLSSASEMDLDRSDAVRSLLPWNAPDPCCAYLKP